MFLSLETLTSNIRTSLPILVELIDLVNSVIIFQMAQMTSLRWLTFLLGSQTVILIVLLFWIYLFLTLVFVLQWLSLHWGILIMLLSRFLLTFNQTHNGMPCFISQLMTILVLIGMVFVIISEMFHWRISLSSAAASDFFEWVRVGIDLYIVNRKYKVKPPPSLWFSAACAAATVHRNHFFVFT